MLRPVVFVMLLVVVLLLRLCHGPGVNAHLLSLALPKLGKLDLCMSLGVWCVYWNCRMAVLLCFEKFSTLFLFMSTWRIFMFYKKKYFVQTLESVQPRTYLSLSCVFVCIYM